MGFARNKKRFRSKRSRRLSFKALLLGGLFFCITGTLMYFLFFSSLVRIKSVVIETQGETKYCSVPEIQEAVEKMLDGRLLKILPRRNILFASIAEIKSELLELFPVIGRADIEIVMPDQMTVTIAERESAGVWCSVHYHAKEQPVSSEEAASDDENTEEVEKEKVEPVTEIRVDECFYIDFAGVIYKKSPLVRSDLLLNIFDAGGQAAGEGAQVVTPQMMEYMIAIKDRIKKVKVGDIALRAQEFEIISPEDIRVSTNQGWQIYFNSSYPLSNQIDLLTGTIDLDECEDILYIDLRIAGRAYYMPVESE